MASFIDAKDARRVALTHREQEVATLVCSGLSNKTVAQRLRVSEGTIKIHLHAVFQKLGIKSRSELIVASRYSDLGGLLPSGPISQKIGGGTK